MSEFMDRFKGKVSQISKDGHIGVVSTASRPIVKDNGQEQQKEPMPIQKPQFLKKNVS